MCRDELFRETFGRGRIFLAVIHVEEASQALRNVAVARDHGAHGAFLINHAVPAAVLESIYRQARAAHPDWWLGLNRLDLTPGRAFQTLPIDASGIWTDGLSLHLDIGMLTLAELMREARDKRLDEGWRGLHFGGVAFKGQPRQGALREEARIGRRFTDVVTTSGPRTGEPPSHVKIRTIRDAIGPDAPLAVASGMTPENVGEYFHDVDAFLVATGISFTHAELDPVRVRALADLIRAS